MSVEDITVQVQSPDAWLLPIVAAALSHRWDCDIARTVRGRRNVTVTRGHVTVRITGPHRAVSATRDTADGVQLVTPDVDQVPALLAAPEAWFDKPDTLLVQPQPEAGPR